MIVRVSVCLFILSYRYIDNFLPLYGGHGTVYRLKDNLSQHNISDDFAPGLFIQLFSKGLPEHQEFISDN
jgi:hypothetical protein